MDYEGNKGTVRPCGIAGSEGERRRKEERKVSFS